MGKKHKRMRNEAKSKKEAKRNKGQGRRGRYFNLFDPKNDPKSQDLPASIRNVNSNGGNEDNTNDKNETLPQVILDIPFVVIAQVISDIKEIENVAEKENVSLKRAQSFQEKKPELQETAPSGWMLGGLKRPPPKTSDFIPIETKRQKHFENHNVYFSPASPETKFRYKQVENLDFISFKTKAVNKNDNYSQKPASNQPSPSTSRDYTNGIKNNFCEEINLSKSKLSKYDNEDLKQDFMSVKTKALEEIKCVPKRQPLLRGGKPYKYGYKDIITGTFDEKLDENLAKNVSICTKSQGNDCLSVAFYEEFQDMITRPQFREIMSFREQLPTFQRSEELLHLIFNNQVIVISGETGCGKSTQVPQIILDSAICQKQGAYVHILVTQPRRIAASSIASRVAQERAEMLGNSVGYAVRLENTRCRPNASIKYVTTGILLAELEVNQGLTNVSHIILDEAHERDSHLDLSMCLLRRVLQKRRDLKLILMSATMDSSRLSEYFGNCPVIHIEGLSYPVQDFYLEDVLSMTGYRLPPDGRFLEDRTENQGESGLSKEEKDMIYKAEIDPWLRSLNGLLDKDVYTTLQDRRIELLNLDLIIALLVHISMGPPGAVLVFLPGITDIFKLMRKMKESDMFPRSNCQIYPLHSRLPSLNQNRIFMRPPPNIRKIVIATNIAETSITIDDVVYVVDCGRVKMRGLNVERNISTLKTEFESKANLIQRRGRAGRCQPGVAYHLMTSYRSQNIPDRILPELQRSNLLESVLQIKKLRLGNALDAFELVPDPPAKVTVEKAVRHLQKIGALDDEERLTPLGWHLARLPVHPAAGKLLLFGALFGCLDRAASVAAVWGFKDPFNVAFGKDHEINQVKRKLSLGEPSDHVAVSEAIIQWEQLDRDKQFQYAQEHFLSENTLKLLCQMKKQLCDNLRHMGFLASKNVRVSWENRNAENLCVFKAIVAAALYPNIAIVRWGNLQNPQKQQRLNITTPEDGKVQLHPSSMMLIPRGHNVPLCNKPGANWLVYWMKQKSTELFLFEVTLVFTLPLLLFGELEMSEVEGSEEECYLSASTVKVRCLKGTADVIFRLRTLLDQVLASMVKETSDRSTRYSEFDNLVFKTVIDLMTLEDERPEGLEDEFTDSSSSDCEIVCQLKPEDRYPIIVID